MSVPEQEPDLSPEDDLADDIAADVSDFVADYLDDEDSGEIQTLSVYISRYPRAQEAIALEYLRLQGAIGRTESSGEGASRDAEGREGEGEAGDQRFAGRYRMLRMLGSGGQGEVWLAEDESLGRRVALKLLKGVFVTEDRRLRFRREAESIARLEHPGLAQVHDAEVDGELPFIAMRFVHGVDLSTSLAQRTRPVEGPETARIEPTLPWVPRSRSELFSVLRFFERAARALHVAHQAGVLHRDVKPGNIMITPEGHPVLLDFGLARDTSDEMSEGDEADTPSAVLTREGDLFGTLSYMSPEQLRGESAQLDARADVWALGVTLYEALVGERPFSGATPLQLAESIEVGKLTGPQAKNSVVTTDVDIVVGTALERSRDRRYASALAFAEDLRRIVHYEPIHARPAGPLLRLGRWCRREPAWAAALVVTLLALTAGLINSQINLAEQRRLLNKNRAAARASAVPALQQKTTAGALALGLQAVGLDDTWLNRSTLYSPLLATTLLSECTMPVARVWDVHFLSETHLVAGSVGGTVAVFDAQHGEMVASVKLPANVHSLVLGDAPGRVLAGLASGDVVGLRLPDSLPTGRPHAERAESRTPAPIAVDWTVHVSEKPVWDLVAGAGMAYCTAAPGGVRAMDAQTGELMAEFRTEDDELIRLELASSGDRLVVADTAFHKRRTPHRSHVVRILEAPSLELVARLDHGEQVLDFDLSDDADVLATMGASGRVRLHDVRTGLDLATESVLGPIQMRHRGAAVAVSPDGRRVALGFGLHGERTQLDVESAPSTLAVFDLDQLGDDGVPEWTARTVQEPVLGVAFSSSGSQLAVSDTSTHVRVFAAAGGHEGMDHVERTRATDLRFSPGDRSLVSFGVGAVVSVWRTRRSPEAFRFDPVVLGEQQPVDWCAFLGDGERAALLERGGRAGVFATPAPNVGGSDRLPSKSTKGDEFDRPEAGTLLFRLDGLQRGVDGVSSSGPEVDGARLAISAGGGLALWVDPERGRARVTELEGGGVLGQVVVPGWVPGPLRALSVADRGLDGSVGATALLVDDGGTAWLWEVGNRVQELRPSEAENGWEHGLFLPPQAIESGTAETAGALRLLLSSSLLEIVALEYEGSDRAGETAFEAPALAPTVATGIRTWVLSPNRDQLVVAAVSGRICRFDPSSGRLLDTPPLRANTEWLSCIDEDRLAVAFGGPGTNVIVGGPEEVRPLAMHASPICAMAVSVEAMAVVTGSEKSAILVWDAETGDPLARMRVHEGSVRCLAAHGGRRDLRILSGAADGALLLPLDAPGAARRLAPRDLSNNDEAHVETVLGGG